MPRCGPSSLTKIRIRCVPARSEGHNEPGSSECGPGAGPERDRPALAGGVTARAKRAGGRLAAGPRGGSVDGPKDVRETFGSCGVGWRGGIRIRIASGPVPRQAAVRLLRCATALRVTRAYFYRSEGSYGRRGSPDTSGVRRKRRSYKAPQSASHVTRGIIPPTAPRALRWRLPLAQETAGGAQDVRA